MAARARSFGDTEFRVHCGGFSGPVLMRIVDATLTLAGLWE
jgi:hypothetical protein